MRLVESPRERLYEVTLGLFSDRTLPNVLLGAFLTSLLQLAVGTVPWTLAALAGLLWALSVGVYAAVDEVRRAIEERKNRLLDPESEFYGIE